jgi:hypothetical protein
MLANNATNIPAGIIFNTILDHYRYLKLIGNSTGVFEKKYVILNRIIILGADFYMWSPE